MSDEQGLRIVLVDEIGNTTTAKLSTDDNQENDICSISTGALSQKLSVNKKNQL